MLTTPTPICNLFLFSFLCSGASKCSYKFKAVACFFSVHLLFPGAQNKATQIKKHLKRLSANCWRASPLFRSPYTASQVCLERHTKGNQVDLLSKDVLRLCLYVIVIFNWLHCALWYESNPVPGGVALISNCSNAPLGPRPQHLALLTYLIPHVECHSNWALCKLYSIIFKNTSEYADSPRPRTTP